MNKIRLAVLGMASIAKRSVIPEVAGSDAFQLAGVASRDAAKAKENATWLHTPVFHGYESILDKQYADAVYIPLPIGLHFQWAMKALEKGLHVWIEKSMVPTALEAKLLVEKASENQLVLLENFQFRFHSQLAYIRNLVHAGEIGAIRAIRASFGFPPFQDPQSIRYQKELGGGALLDTGTYPLKISQLFMSGDPEVVAASLYYDPQTGVDSWGGAFLKEKEGPLFAQLAFGFDQNYECSLELWGSKGKLYTNRIFTAPPDCRPVLFLDKGGKKTTLELDADNAFKNMLAHFHHLILNPEARDHEYRQNMQQAVLLEQIRSVAGL